MVKFSNKAKGKPTKRKTLKTKYKIERKVKQHRKKIRKEARKLGQKGIKPRSTSLIIQETKKPMRCPTLSPSRTRSSNISSLRELPPRVLPLRIS